MLRHTKCYAIGQSFFLQHALFCHVCNSSLYIISVEAEMADREE